MSVALFKYDGYIYDRSSKIILSQPLATEATYLAVWEPIAQELNVRFFLDGSEIHRENLEEAMEELDRMEKYIRENECRKDYFLPRIEAMKEILPRELVTDEDVLYVF